MFYEDGEPGDILEHYRLDINIQMSGDSFWNLKHRRLQDKIEIIGEK